MQDINRRVLVTASSKGLGKAIAYEFAMNDYDVILHGRDEEKVRQTKELLENDSVEYRNRKIDVSCIVGDLRSNITIDELYKISKDKISVLVNNYPLLKKQGYGSIININSIVGKEPKKFRSVHSATKWGLKGFSKSLRVEAEENGIKVINVYPTQIKTVKEHTFGLEPYDVAKKIYEEHIDGDTGELVLDGRPEKYKPKL